MFWGSAYEEMKRLLAAAILGVSLTVLIARPASAERDAGSSEPSWAAAVARITAAKEAGTLSADEAAELRLIAITDISRLPEEYLPSPLPQEDSGVRPKSDEPSARGLSILASKLDALFIDESEWSPQTRERIMNFFINAPPSLPNLPNTETTDHFVIHWTDQGPDAPPQGALYIQAIAKSLEDAWDALESPSYGYAMPDPIDFGRIPDPTDGIARFDVFVIEDITTCLLPINAPGVTTPGEIRLKPNRPLDEIDTLTAHELFHMLQWNYAGFRDSRCAGVIGAGLWYSSDSAWLMESTSTWIEDEIYPADDAYLSTILRYTNFPEISLFSRTTLAPNHEYGAVVFTKFLQEHLAGPAGYSNDRDIVRSIWERVPLESTSTVDAITYVLMNPPSGANPYADFADTWTSIFDDFAIANYLKDYADGPAWPVLASIEITDTKKPIAEPNYPVMGNQLGFGWPAAQYIEVFPDDLTLPDGPDATGATLQLDISTDCPRCTLDVLEFGAFGGAPVRTAYLLEDTGQSGPAGPIIGAFEDISLDFGAPGGTEKVVVIFVNPYLEFAFPWEYEYTFTAIDNPPQAPEDLEAFADEFADLIELTWDEVNEDAISYRVYRDTNSPVPLDDDHLIAIVQNDDYQDASISPNVEYRYVITAVDDGGNESDPSNEASAVLPGPTPTPPPSGTTITVRIDQGVDDAGPDPGNGCAYATYWNEVYFGECFNGSDITSGFRFGNVQIPQGAEIQSAYLDFTVNGPYTNELMLRIRGEDTGDAGSFDQNRKPDNLALTSSSVQWVIPSSDPWGLGNERQTPDLSAVVQEIVDRPDWSPGNGIAVVVQNDGDAGGLHRRVIGFERPLQTYSGHLAELVVNYAGDPPPAVTPTPTPTPTATPTPLPTPTQRPCECAILCLVEAPSSTAQSSGSSLAMRARGLLSVVMPQTAELWDGVELLQQVRDQILVKSPEGSRYIDLYAEHSPELALILLADSDLREQGFETIDLFRPGLEALLEGRGDEVAITEAQVSAVEQFLDEIAAVANPALAQVIADERAANPLAQLSGMTMAEALGDLTDNQPPDAEAGTGYVVEEGDFIDLQGTGTDPEGDPLTFEWDLNNDGRYDVTGQSVVFSAVGLDGLSTRSVTLRVCDDKAGCEVSEATVQILNSAPLVAVDEPSEWAEGDSITFNGIFIDQGADTHVIQWSFGDGSTATGALEPEHTFSDDGDYQVTLTVTDDDDGTGSDSVSVTISNAPPMLGEITAAAVPVQVGIAVEFSATISDPGSADTHSGTWVWGDGIVTDPATVVDDAAGRRAEDSHTYSLPGTYTIQLQVSDDDGAVVTKELTVVVESGFSLLNFVLLGEEGIYLKQNSTVVSGDLGANLSSDGPYLAGSQEVTVGLGVTLQDPASRVMGDSIKLKRNSQVYDVYYNELTGLGDVLGQQFTPLELPLISGFPVPPVAAPGTEDFDVAQNDSLTLDEGSYGLLKARLGSTITFTGGVYDFSEWDVGRAVTLYIEAPSEFRIAGRLAVDQNSTLGPAPSPSNLSAADIVIHVLGINGNTGKLGATPKAAKFGIGTSILANVYVPEGTLWLRQNGQFTGSFLGRWVILGIGASAELESGWQ